MGEIVKNAAGTTLLQGAGSNLNVGSTQTASATNAVASITATEVGGFAWSYSAALTTTPGTVTIVDGATTVFSMDVTGEGAGYVRFSKPKVSPTGGNLTVSLSAGGSGVVGKINLI